MAIAAILAYRFSLRYIKQLPLKLVDFFGFYLPSLFLEVHNQSILPHLFKNVWKDRSPNTHQNLLSTQRDGFCITGI